MERFSLYPRGVYLASGIYLTATQTSILIHIQDLLPATDASTIKFTDETKLPVFG